MNGTRRIIVAAAVIATVAATSMAVALAGSAPRASAASAPEPQAVDPVAWSDFDDDGLQDLAIGAPGTASSAGSVFVFYGTATGLSTDRFDEWHQNVLAINDTRETGDRFGTALAAGDFNKDGVADLAIGAPGEDRPVGPGPDRPDAGLVHVIFGNDGAGLSAAGDVTITPTAGQLPAGDPTLRWIDSEFGAALVALDWFDTVAPVDQAPDGFADLAIGAPGFDDGIGLAIVIKGPDIAPNPTVTLQGWLDVGILFMLPDGTRPASTLAAGNLDGEGFDDLAIGCPLCDVDDQANAGAVFVFSFEVSLQFLSEGFDGNPAAPASNDVFGASLATGDFNGDGIDELAVGVPGKDLDGHLFAGQVQIYTGNGQGLGAPFRTVDERAPEVLSEPVSLERFGQSLAVGNFGRSVGLDLAVGALRERVGSVSGAGAVFVFYNNSSGTGLTAVNSQRFTQNTAGMPNASETNDQFGSSLAVGQFQRGGTHDLVIGVDLEDLPADNAHPNAGLIHVLYGKANGLTTTDDQPFNMASAGLPGFEDQAKFGAALR